jgi:hypothetical protein
MTTQKRSHSQSQSLSIPYIASDSVSSSEEEYNNEIIKNMYIKFENARNEYIITHPKDLEYYNKLYECKRKLDEKNLVFYINDMDLIELSNDKSNIIHLRIIKGSAEPVKDPNPNLKSPKESHSPRRETRSRSNSAKDKDSSKIKKNQIGHAMLFSFSDGEVPRTNVPL